MPKMGKLYRKNYGGRPSPNQPTIHIHLETGRAKQKRTRVMKVKKKSFLQFVLEPLSEESFAKRAMKRNEEKTRQRYAEHLQSACQDSEFYRSNFDKCATSTKSPAERRSRLEKFLQ